MKLVARRFFVTLLSGLLVLQPLLVQAQEIRADQGAGAANRPTIGAAGNGVPLVDIATPNGAGLSHNRYETFNVGEPGLILNNSNQELSRSQLGGLVQGNANLRDSGPARVILNEVTGANRSALNGVTEIHGGAADLIIANPNGLTCSGCGFWNAPRVTLSTGLPVLGADGSLSGLRVEGGDILIGERGADAGSVDIFDIVSRKISVKGTVKGRGGLNLVAGRNSYDYASGLVTALPSDGNEPAIAIDSSLLGGMYAGRIKIISTDRGSGVNMQGQMAANAGAMTLTSDGKITLGKVKATGPIKVRSVRQAVRVEDTLFSGEAIELKGLTSVELADRALVASGGDVAMQARSVTLGDGALAATGVDEEGRQTATGTLAITAETLDAGKGQLASGGLLSIHAAAIDISRAGDTGADTLRSLSGIQIETGSISGAYGRVTAAADITI